MHRSLYNLSFKNIEELNNISLILMMLEMFLIVKLK